MPKGITIKVNGDCNDYLGKGLSGGKIIVKNQKIVILIQKKILYR